MFGLVYIPWIHNLKAFILFYFIYLFLGLDSLNPSANFSGEEARLASSLN